jgi:glycosyltransferase involved in cell wall biosynthesis
MKGRYLMVTPMPALRTGPGTFAAESAFIGHVRLLRAKLGDLAQELVIAGPELDPAHAGSSALAGVDEALDGIRFSSLFPIDAGPLGFLQRLPAIVRALRDEVRAADVVHAGNSQLYFPYEFITLLLASFLGKNTISVTDIDQRRSARMKYRAGHWTLSEYLITRALHDPFQHLQQLLGVRRFSLVLLKGAQLVRDYGAARPNVKNFLDSAFSSEHVISRQALATKLQELAAPSTPLRAVYFGRLVAYKGVDAMLQAVARAVDDGARLRFDIIGSGPEEASLRAMSRALGLDEVVHFIEAVPFGPALFELLYRAHVLLAAPLSEDTPRSALDACAAGVAVLAYDTQYYKELESLGAPVALVPWGRVAALADRLLELERGRQQLGELLQKAVSFAADNTQEIWLERRVDWTRRLFELAPP